jgi:predicted RNA-binding Zn-ribbon protein involved in translation (DUF1610 family)
VKNERTDDGVPYFVTCTYCGTQTQLSFNQVESAKPFKCPECGAPFKVVPPRRPKRRSKPHTETNGNAGRVLIRPFRDDGAGDALSRDVAAAKLILAVIGVVVFFVLFIVALISTC